MFGAELISQLRLRTPMEQAMRFPRFAESLRRTMSCSDAEKHSFAAEAKALLLEVYSVLADAGDGSHDGSHDGSRDAAWLMIFVRVS